MDIDIVRSDGRKNLDFRKTYIKTDIIKTAKGSAYLEQGNTKIVCAVFGPKEISTSSAANLSNLKSFTNKRKSQSIIKSTKGILICKVTLAPFCQKQNFHSILCDQNTINPIKTNIDSQNCYYSECLTETLESAINLLQYPKSQIEIYAFVLEDDGSLLSALINCASLAIITSGIEAFDVLSSSTILMMPNLTKPFVYLDPDKNEELHVQGLADAGKLVIGYLPSLTQTSFISHSGQVCASSFNELMKTSIMTATVFAEHLRSYLKSWAKLKKDSLNMLSDSSKFNETHIPDSI